MELLALGVCALLAVGITAAVVRLGAAWRRRAVVQREVKPENGGAQAPGGGPYRTAEPAPVQQCTPERRCRSCEEAVLRGRE